jgi:hypothetical protein
MAIWIGTSAAASEKGIGTAPALAAAAAAAKTIRREACSLRSKSMTRDRRSVDSLGSNSKGGIEKILEPVHLVAFELVGLRHDVQHFSVRGDRKSAFLDAVSKLEGNRMKLPIAPRYLRQSRDDGHAGIVQSLDNLGVGV